MIFDDSVSPPYILKNNMAKLLLKELKIFMMASV